MYHLGIVWMFSLLTSESMKKLNTVGDSARSLEQLRFGGGVQDIPWSRTKDNINSLLL